MPAPEIGIRLVRHRQLGLQRKPVGRPCPTHNFLAVDGHGYLSLAHAAQDLAHLLRIEEMAGFGARVVLARLAVNPIESIAVAAPAVQDDGEAVSRSNQR